ncbi:MAG: Isomerizing Glutamine-fructose-6-phosphate aminotransferase [candidate division CPR2 bacterium GW2011_GWC1_39_9]|uniref:Glutamine--fructose-6-phosphate aminotransferase [isomerizing] n=1 Tax=candidate division CPR2 bacterium GW2011_GWC2_39_10 TaxID=1618345 RepID=A0A0G0P5I0_UNCC2|nr:MAG: Isomerizing Glutamine-fructose-6-phosphate aminotransferase [candidate division CPR2 bacterium GW2011_GWC2_39_10]KKR33019.1 MAG: Isomerizing Glutamine-fructose-6-phosphate aminotransferase [candidate division CPR2 bacterium GW2011_GWC1_39_9]
MCGIVGYIGFKNAKEILISGLKRLEYRGYDSAGMALVGQELDAIKAIGKIVNLEEKINGFKKEAKLGVAHTRWATHGAPTEENAHPHLSCDKKIAVVHNGIIENYAALKEKLQRSGHKFLSETDTEVLAHLIEENFKGDLLKAVMDALSVVEGTYGLAVIHSGQKDKIVVARNGSPLVIGVGKGENFIASDAAAILAYTDKVIYLGDKEVALLTMEDVSIFDLKSKPLKKEISKIDWDLEAIEKDGYDHFMLKEIMDQPQAIKNGLAGRVSAVSGNVHLGGINITAKEFASVRRIVITACGTSWHAGLIGEFFLEKLAGIPTEVEYASEFRYRNPIIDPGTLLMAISQSGETADTLAALREAKQKGAKTLGIINVVGSTIAREVDGGMYIHAGPEIGVASTKAFTCQVSSLVMLSVYLGRMRNLSMSEASNVLHELLLIPAKIDKILSQTQKIKKIAADYSKYSDFLYLGRNLSYPVALEGALKLKEISYIHAEGYPAAEMKHGPIALIDPAFPSVFIIPKNGLYEKTISNIEEIKARSGRVLAIAQEGDNFIKNLADDVIYIPESHEVLSPLLSVIPLQLLSYFIAIMKGCDVDRPRNLAKSVTVE